MSIQICKTRLKNTDFMRHRTKGQHNALLFDAITAKLGRREQQCKVDPASYVKKAQHRHKKTTSTAQKQRQQQRATHTTSKNNTNENNNKNKSNKKISNSAQILQKLIK